MCLSWELRGRGRGASAPRRVGGGCCGRNPRVCVGRPVSPSNVAVVYPAVTPLRYFAGAVQVASKCDGCVLSSPECGMQRTSEGGGSSPGTSLGESTAQPTEIKKASFFLPDPWRSPLSHVPSSAQPPVGAGSKRGQPPSTHRAGVTICVRLRFSRDGAGW